MPVLRRYVDHPPPSLTHSLTPSLSRSLAHLVACCCCCCCCSDGGKKVSVNHLNARLCLLGESLFISLVWLMPLPSLLPLSRPSVSHRARPTSRSTLVVVPSPCHLGQRVGPCCCCCCCCCRRRCRCFVAGALVRLCSFCFLFSCSFLFLFPFFLFFLSLFFFPFCLFFVRAGCCVLLRCVRWAGADGCYSESFPFLLGCGRVVGGGDGRAPDPRASFEASLFCGCSFLWVSFVAFRAPSLNPTRVC